MKLYTIIQLFHCINDILYITFFVFNVHMIEIVVLVYLIVNKIDGVYLFIYIYIYIY